jgi:hypothetical protein
LAALIGCKSSELSGFLALQQAESSQIVVGTPNEVALSVKTSLEKLSLKVEASEQGDQGNAYYLTCRTKSGARFKLVLTRDKSGTAEQTHIRLDWLDARDATFGLHLLADVKKPA